MRMSEKCCNNNKHNNNNPDNPLTSRRTDGGKNNLGSSSDNWIQATWVWDSVSQVLKDNCDYPVRLFISCNVMYSNTLRELNL